MEVTAKINKTANVTLIFFCHDLIIKTQALIPVLGTGIHTSSSTTCFK